MTDDGLDGRIRLAAFSFLEEQVRRHTDVVPYSTLQQGFSFSGQRVPLLGPQGIFKPAVLKTIPLSITTAPVVEGKRRPYEDDISTDGTLTYRYRGRDVNHHENVGLRTAMQRRVPLVYLFGVAKGLYLPSWPVFIVGDDPATLSFKVAVDDASNLGFQGPEAFNEGEPRRRYITVQTQRRLHQVAFRERVLAAYRRLCAVCRLQHEELLDAAHILPDGHPKGEPVVRNGLSLCKLHHAAFDGNILGISPNLEVVIRLDILQERDGPMLLHGLQGFQGCRIVTPRSANLQPDREFLAERYELFRKAS